MPKPTLILLPGLVSDHAVWAGQTKALSSQYRILIPDLSKPNTPAAMVEAVLQQAPESFALAGHSMGGWVALEVMRVAGERVTKLALLNTTAVKDSKTKMQSRLDLIALLKAGEVDVLIERLLGVFIYQQHCRESVRKMIFRNLSALINQEEAMLLHESCESVLSFITCKTLIVSANQDKIFNEEDASLLHEGIANSYHVTLDDCGHMSPMEVPEAVNFYLSEWLALS